jgi:hypothetical protein
MSWSISAPAGTRASEDPGASDLLIEVFGEERGSHARIALYQSDLPREAPIACELTLFLQHHEDPPVRAAGGVPRR